MIHLVLLAFAFVCFVLSAVGVPNPPAPRFNLVAAGLAFWVASTFIVR